MLKINPLRSMDTLDAPFNACVLEFISSKCVRVYVQKFLCNFFLRNGGGANGGRCFSFSRV